MPKYKDVPEVRAAKRERKEKLREFLSLLDMEHMSDIKYVFKAIIESSPKNCSEASLMMNLVVAGMTIETRTQKNSRNGRSPKTVKTSAEAVEIAAPRYQNGNFDPQIIKKNETSLSGDRITDFCIILYM